MWSVGCIFAELLHGKPIFPGKDEVGCSSIDVISFGWNSWLDSFNLVFLNKWFKDWWTSTKLFTFLDMPTVLLLNSVGCHTRELGFFLEAWTPCSPSTTKRYWIIIAHYYTCPDVGHVMLIWRGKKKCILLESACLYPDKHHKDYPIVLVLKPSFFQGNNSDCGHSKTCSQFLVRKMSFFRPTMSGFGSSTNFQFKFLLE